MFIWNRVSLKTKEPKHGAHPTILFLRLPDGDDGESTEGEVDARRFSPSAMKRPFCAKRTVTRRSGPNAAAGRLSFASRARGTKKCRSAGDGALHPGLAISFRRRAVAASARPPQAGKSPRFTKEMRDAACRCTELPRALVSLAVPPSQPSEAYPAVLFSRSQKASVFLVEMCEDPRSRGICRG
jgi:hypothetical protein